jgi:hypothetical protein
MPKEGQTSATMGPQPRDTERKPSHKTQCDAGLLYSLYTIFNLIFLVCGDLIYIYKELVYAVGFIFCAWNSVLYHAPRAAARSFRRHAVYRHVNISDENERHQTKHLRESSYPVLPVVLIAHI